MAFFPLGFYSVPELIRQNVHQISFYKQEKMQNFRATTRDTRTSAMARAGEV